MRVKIEMIVDLGDSFCDFENKNESEWFEHHVMNKQDIKIHSNEIGDELGEIDDLKWSYINDEKLIF